MSTRRIIIEIGPARHPDSPGLFDVVLEDGRCCDGLSWDEMIGQVIELTHPKLGQPHYRMQTPAEWDSEREQRRQGRGAS